MTSNIGMVNNIFVVVDVIHGSVINQFFIWSHINFLFFNFHKEDGYLNTTIWYVNKKNICIWKCF